MRKVVASEYISLDGVIEAGWSGQTPAIAPTDELTGPYFNDTEVGQAVGSLTASGDTMLLGRVTYEGFASFFSDATGEVADQMNAMPKLVVSSTLDEADWQNSTIINGNIAGQITELKRQSGKNINVSGSATLVRWLLRERLLDELHLLVFPVVMGSGQRLFDGGPDQAALQLAACTALGNGVVHLTYTPRRD